MKFSEIWLRSWVDTKLSSHELAHALTMAGLEVETLESVAPPFSDVVVAEVLEVTKHPNADRLNLCQVNVGDGMPLSIVCGAPNVAVGIKVPCARIGAILPDGLVIKRAKVRGVDSFGMLCSGTELGLVGENQGLWLLPDDSPVGMKLRDYMELDDTLFTLKLTPNRSDCLSIAGVAREVAAITGGTLNTMQAHHVHPTLTEVMAIQVSAPEVCPLYCGRVIRDINAMAVTPLWMNHRLERGGVRSVNAVVDITNYVMLELGQPIHAFDRDKIIGEVVVRYARAGEELTLLNGQNVIPQNDMVVTSDDVKLLALAGIMSGAESGVGDATHNVFLESAFFAPDAIIGKARKLNIATDSSYRFERGVDFCATGTALERATQLLLEICGGQAGPISEVRKNLPARDPITLRLERVNRVLGTRLDSIEVVAILRRLQLKAERQNDNLLVTPPSYRFDLLLEVDLIEEIARVIGYDNIPAQPLRTAARMVSHTEVRRPVSRLRNAMVARDYQETISYAFVDAETELNLCANTTPVTLKNPLSNHLAVMRSSLLGGLVGALRVNLVRKQSRVRLFEVGACFFGGNYAQREQFAGLCCGTQLSEQWGEVTRNVDFYDVKADVEALFPSTALLSFVASPHPASHPGRSAQVWAYGRAVGWIGELHPKWLQQYDISQAVVWFEVEMDALVSVDLPCANEIYKSLPVRRDLAVVVDEGTTAQSLLDAMRDSGAPHVTELALFDLYRGKGVENGKKSLAFRVLLQDTEKTLIDSEIELSIAHLTAVLQKHGAQLRI